MSSSQRNFPGARYLQAFNRLRIGRIPIWIDFPIEFKPRWTNGPGHPQLAALLADCRPAMAAGLAELATLLPVVEKLNARAWPELSRLDWFNHQIPALDALTLMWAGRKARSTYMEVGSGYSTLYVKAGLLDAGSTTRIVSIDPMPRADCDAVCDEVIRQKLEDLDLARFDELEAGDVLFIDNSHRSLMNSDVTVFMLDVLPRLKPGVMIGIHDIFIPFDYPASWSERGYSEQYMLASFLLANRSYLDIRFANHWMHREGMHRAPLQGIWSILGDKVRDRPASAFWAVKA